MGSPELHSVTTVLWQRSGTAPRVPENRELRRTWSFRLKAAFLGDEAFKVVGFFFLYIYIP